MKNQFSMNELYANVKKDPVFSGLIPIGFGAGLPILSIKNEQLLISIPYFRVQLTGVQDKTQIFPVQFVTTVTYPSCSIISFSNLAFCSDFSEVDFGMPVGLFRHKAIITLNHGEYEEKRRDLLDLYDHLIFALFNSEEPSYELINKFTIAINIMIEPSLKPFYRRLDVDFYNKFLLGESE